MLESVKEYVERMGGIDATLRYPVADAVKIRQPRDGDTFEDLCECDPRLRKLRDRIPEMMTHGGFWQQWSAVKREMCRFVGYTSIGPLCGQQDYDIAYRELWEIASRFER
jgi:hypothetical protein